MNGFDPRRQRRGVTLAARETTDCTAQHAVCDAVGRKFSGTLSLTVPGPQTLPVVSIATSTTPVTEGTAASFTLSRTGDTTAELTVQVSVSESGAAVSGTAPTSVTFAAESSTATLSVATEDDEAVEDASTAAADLSWSIPAGADAAKDYELPDDAGTDGEYAVTVRVTDGANPVDASLVVRLSDVDDTAPRLSRA